MAAGDGRTPRARNEAAGRRRHGAAVRGAGAQRFVGAALQHQDTRGDVGVSPSTYCAETSIVWCGRVTGARRSRELSRVVDGTSTGGVVNHGQNTGEAGELPPLIPRGNCGRGKGEGESKFVWHLCPVSDLWQTENKACVSTKCAKGAASRYNKQMASRKTQLACKNVRHNCKMCRHKRHKWYRRRKRCKRHGWHKWHKWHKRHKTVPSTDDIHILISSVAPTIAR